jgi:DNA invertase Pin-like site-specific DNA recombinase
MADARRRAFDVLVVTKLDRLARSTRHLLNLAADLNALGVALVVVEQSIDTSTPSGELLFTVLGAIAQFERALIRERVAAGMRAARKRGRRLGRPRALTDDQLARLRRLHEGGASQRRIAETLGVSKGSVGRALAQLRQERPAA